MAEPKIGSGPRNVPAVSTENRANDLDRIRQSESVEQVTNEALDAIEQAPPTLPRGGDAHRENRAIIIHQAMKEAVGRGAKEEEAAILDDIYKDLLENKKMEPSAAAAEFKRVVAEGWRATAPTVDGIIEHDLKRTEWDGGFWHANAVRMHYEGKPLSEITTLVRSGIRQEPEWKLNNTQEWITDVYQQELRNRGTDPSALLAFSSAPLAAILDAH
jgi:hypothetical protein